MMLWNAYVCSLQTQQSQAVGDPKSLLDSYMVYISTVTHTASRCPSVTSRPLKQNNIVHNSQQ